MQRFEMYVWVIYVSLGEKVMSTSGWVQRKQIVVSSVLKKKDTISGVTTGTFVVKVPDLFTLQETKLAEGEEKPLNVFLLE